MAQNTENYVEQLNDIKTLLAKQDTLLKSMNTEEIRAFKAKYPGVDEIIHKETKTILQEEGILAPEQPKVKTMAAKRRNYI